MRMAEINPRVALMAPTGLTPMPVLTLGAYVHLYFISIRRFIAAAGSVLFES